MKNPHAEARTADYVEPVLSTSHGLEDIHEDSQKETLLEEDTKEAHISFPINVSSKGDTIASVDGELEGWYHSSSEG